MEEGGETKVGAAQVVSRRVTDLSQLAAQALDRGPLRLSTPIFDLADPQQARIGDYLLLEKIGEGGSGIVYRARQLSLAREVALKLLAASPLTDDDFLQRFRLEAQAAARLQHAGIVPIYDFGEAEGLSFIAMAYVRGRSLAQLLLDGPLAPERATRYALLAALAADYAHREGVLHLDLKPGNVLIDVDDHLQIADFGLARRMDETLASITVAPAGTPAYMAPEQTVVGERLTPATDIYALGAVLYEMLTGRAPFVQSTIEPLLAAVRSQEPLPPRRLAARVPPELERICLRCLRKDPLQRYRSAAALVVDLEKFVRPHTRLERVRRHIVRAPPVAAMVVAAALAVAAAGWVWWRSAPASPPPALAAEDFILLGRHYWDRRTSADVARGLRFFERAVAADANSAAAWSGLADSYIMQYEYGDLGLAEVTAKARPAIARAKQLAPESGDGYASEGLLLLNLGEYAQARQVLRRAVEFDQRPIYFTWLGTSIMYDGNPREALGAYDHALGLDAGNAVTHTYRGIALALTGKDTAAVEEFKAARAINPRYLESWWQEGLTQMHYGHHAAALAAFRQGEAMAPKAWTQAFAAHLLLMLGADKEAGQALTVSDAMGSGDIDLAKARVRWLFTRGDYAGAKRYLLQFRPEADQLWLWALLGQAEILAGEPQDGAQTMARAFAGWDGAGAPFALPLEPAFNLDLLANWAAVQPQGATPDARAAYRNYLHRLEAGGVDLPVMDYFRATDAALGGDAAQALHFLQRSLERGYVDVHALQYDLAWRELRSQPEFKEFAAAAAARAARIRADMKLVE